MSNKQSTYKKVIYWSGVVAIGLAVGVGAQFSQAWLEPSGGPGDTSVLGPVTLGSQPQVKAGGLGVTNLDISWPGNNVNEGALVIKNGKGQSVETEPDDVSKTLVTKGYMENYVATNGGGSGGTGGSINAGNFTVISCEAAASTYNNFVFPDNGATGFENNGPRQMSQSTPPGPGSINTQDCPSGKKLIFAAIEDIWNLDSDSNAGSGCYPRVQRINNDTTLRCAINPTGGSNCFMKGVGLCL